MYNFVVTALSASVAISIGSVELLESLVFLIVQTLPVSSEPVVTELLISGFLFTIGNNPW